MAAGSRGMWKDDKPSVFSVQVQTSPSSFALVLHPQAPPPSLHPYVSARSPWRGDGLSSFTSHVKMLPFFEECVFGCKDGFQSKSSAPYKHYIILCLAWHSPLQSLWAGTAEEFSSVEPGAFKHCHIYRFPIITYFRKLRETATADSEKGTFCWTWLSSYPRIVVVALWESETTFAEMWEKLNRCGYLRDDLFVGCLIMERKKMQCRRWVQSIICFCKKEMLSEDDILQAPKTDHITCHHCTMHWLPIDVRIKYKHYFNCFVLSLLLVLATLLICSRSTRLLGNFDLFRTIVYCAFCQHKVVQWTLFLFHCSNTLEYTFKQH